MAEPIRLVQVPCSVCRAYTFHVVTRDDLLVCLSCRAAGKETDALKPPKNPLGCPSLDSAFISARSLN